MKKRNSLFILCALLWLACAKKITQNDELQSALAIAHSTEPCSTIIPMNWAPSIPIPADKRSATRFAIFFYPLPDRMGDQWMGGPSGHALIDLNADQAISCARDSTSLKKLDLRKRFSPGADRLNVQELTDKRAELDLNLEQLAWLYTSTQTLNVQGLAQLKSFGELFSLLAEPPFLPFYYRLNPDFWIWAKKNGAQLPPEIDPRPSL